MIEADDLNPLLGKVIEKKLKDFPGWEFRDNKLIKQFQFKDFSDVLDFLNKLIPYCNKLDHHPDVHIYFRKVTFELTRYSIGGKVTARDFDVARKIETLYKNWPK